MKPRDVIREHLVEMVEDLNVFEQTTHGCLGPFSIETVCSAMESAYLDPTPYNLSTLSQHIRGFLKL